MLRSPHVSRTTFALLFLCGSLLLARPCAAEPAGDAAAATKDRLRLSTERLVIFKDGYGLVIKKATATADADGRVYTTDVPEGAILGCFWAVSEDKKILAMRADWDQKRETRQKETACLSVAELLRANLGKAVTLQLTDKTNKGTNLSEEGKLVEVLELPAEPLVVGAPHGDSDALPAIGAAQPMFTAYIHEGIVTYGSFQPETIATTAATLIRELTPRGGEFLRLERDGVKIVLPVSHVESVQGKDLVTRMTRQEELYTRSKRLSFDLGKEAAGKAAVLHLLYFTPGLRWIPTYRVTGDLKDKADIALQGEILNDVTDVEKAAVDLVVGVPNFRFKGNPSPLTLERTMRGVAASIAANTYTGNSTLNLSNGGNMLQAQFANNDFRGAQPREAAGGGEDFAMAPELAGAGGEQDLFVYSANDFSLKKGARATMPLWQETSALRHVYTYDIRAKRSHASGGFVENPAEARSPLQIQMNQVWHQLELTNAGKVPWTTGAALMLRGNLPLGQDLLTYTPPGGKALVPVTIAVDLRGSFDEQETSRKPNALHQDGYDYSLVTKKGTVTLNSYRKEKSDMRVTVSTGGKVTAASDDAKIKLNDFRQDDWDNNNSLRVNNHSDVSWEFSIDPGQTRTLTYEVSFYLR